MSAGFSLIEVLISLIILAFILLGFDALQIHALRENQRAYFITVATNQLFSLAEQLRESDNSTDVTSIVTEWNNQNKEVLPEGRGIISGNFPDYWITIFWGNHHLTMQINK